jgi:hypothetical protein
LTVSARNKSSSFREPPNSSSERLRILHEFIVHRTSHNVHWHRQCACRALQSVITPLVAAEAALGILPQSNFRPRRSTLSHSSAARGSSQWQSPSRGRERPVGAVWAFHFGRDERACHLCSRRCRPAPHLSCPDRRNGRGISWRSGEAIM